MKRQGAFYTTPTKRSKTLAVVPSSKQDAEISSLRRQTTQLASEVRKLKNSQEIHYHDEKDVGLATPYDVVNRVAILCDPAQGDGRTNRSGDSITPLSIDLRMKIAGNSTIASVARILLIQAKTRFVPDSTANTGTSAVWEEAGTSLAPLSNFYWDNRNDFVVLHDECVEVGPTGGSDSSVTYRHIHKKLHRKINYIGGTTGPTEGQIFLVMTSTVANTGGTAPVIKWHSRVRFLDS